MDIFVEPEWEPLCQDEKQQQRVLGKDGARKLRARLEDLAAAGNVSELVAGRPHPLTGDRAGCFALDPHKGWRLVFAPAHQPIPQHDAGGIAWERVTAVRIVYVGDYHD